MNYGSLLIGTGSSGGGGTVGASSSAATTKKSNRQVSLVDRIEFTWENNSNVFSNALALGDVDNDPNGDCELVVGNIEGSLSIFKGDVAFPWKTSNALGTVPLLFLLLFFTFMFDPLLIEFRFQLSGLAIGDVHNNKKVGNVSQEHCFSSAQSILYDRTLSSLSHSTERFMSSTSTTKIQQQAPIT